MIETYSVFSNKVIEDLRICIGRDVGATHIVPMSSRPPLPLGDQSVCFPTLQQVKSAICDR